MGHVVSLDSQGRMVYEGLLSSKEKATIDEILHAVKEEIPKVEEDLEGVYGNGVLYKYHLGKYLGTLLDKYQITISERRKFWDEIKDFATQKSRLRDEGVNAVTRSFYQQCYMLSLREIETVEKMSWRQWQDLFDRVGNREDERIFLWINNQKEKIREDDWREFEKALHLYLRKKDTSVFSEEELFDIYDSLYEMCKTWRLLFKEFALEHPKSEKIKKKGTWAKKYYARCFDLKKEIGIATVTKEICKDAFNQIM